MTLAFPEYETAKNLEAKSQPKLESLLNRVVDRVFETGIIRDAIDNIGGGYVSRVDMEAMREIQPDDCISRKIRPFGFPPYDGAHIVIDGKNYTLMDRFILQEMADPSTNNLFPPLSPKPIV